MIKEELRIQLIRRYVDSLTEEERHGIDANVLVSILVQKPQGVGDMIKLLDEI